MKARSKTSGATKKSRSKDTKTYKRAVALKKRQYAAEINAIAEEAKRRQAQEKMHQVFAEQFLEFERLGIDDILALAFLVDNAAFLKPIVLHHINKGIEKLTDAEIIKLAQKLAQAQVGPPSLAIQTFTAAEITNLAKMLAEEPAEPTEELADLFRRRSTSPKLPVYLL